MEVIMLIPFIVEPEYGSSVFTPAIRAGIESELSRKKYSSVFIEPTDLETADSSFFDSKLAVLIGTSPNFVANTVSILSKKDVGVLLVCNQPPENFKIRGVVRTDYAAGIYTLLELLLSCGSKRPALYGCFPDSSTDLIKKKAYFEYAASAGFKPVTIDNQNGLVNCFNEFEKLYIAENIDSLLCVNDIAAISLMKRLQKLGVKVPNEIQIVSLGGSELARMYEPKITVLEMENFELGRQVVNAFSYLTKNTSEINLSVRVHGDLVIGDSTKKVCCKPVHMLQTSTGSGSFYEDDEVKNIACAEKLLSVCDELDRKMLAKMLSGSSTEKTAEELSLAVETVRYRVRRILSGAGFENRAGLLDFIRENGFEILFVKEKYL